MLCARCTRHVNGAEIDVSLVGRLVEENERLTAALRWVLTYDYGDSIIPPQHIADTMTIVAKEETSERRP